MKKPAEQRYHLWFQKNNGRRRFLSSHKTEEEANARRNYLDTFSSTEGQYIVLPSDITTDEHKKIKIEYHE